MYGMDIFTDNATYVGKVNDIILNLESGDVVRITTEPLKNITGENVRELLQKKSVLFKRVKSVRDIMIITERGGAVHEEDVEMEAPSAPSDPKAEARKRIAEKLARKYSR